MEGWDLFGVFSITQLEDVLGAQPRVANEADPNWEQQRRDLENSGEMSQHEGNSRLAKLDEDPALSLLVLVRSQDTTWWDNLRSSKETHIKKKQSIPPLPPSTTSPELPGTIGAFHITQQRVGSSGQDSASPHLDHATTRPVFPAEDLAQQFIVPSAAQSCTDGGFQGEII